MKNKSESKNLHPTENKLLGLTRQLKNGRIFLKVRDGLPMVAEIAEERKVVFNAGKKND